MITNSLLQYSDLQCEYLGSDHEAVQFDVLLATPTIQNNQRHVRAYDHANWDRYQRDIVRRLDTDMNIDQINSTHQIDNIVQNFTDSLMTAQDEFVPLIPPHRHELQLTPEIVYLIHLRRIY